MRSSNASSSAWGWEFQSNAAIMLMLKNIENASKVKVEGDTEDIEITFSNGKMLLSQAKAVTNPDDYSNVRKKLEAGLRTLNSAAKLENVEQLVFVTNSPNPFKQENTMYKFSSPLNIVPFSELPEVCKKIVHEMCIARNYDFDTSLLTICVMQFYGEKEDERFKVISNLTTEFLNNLGVSRLSTNQLLTLWQHMFTVNASQRATFISKKRMVWPIIAFLCEVNEDDTALGDYDESDVIEIIQRYRRVINNNCESFEFISRVISDYNEFHPEMKSKERSERFISEKWENYEDDFDLKNSDSDIRKIVICLTVSNVLRSRRIISSIKGKVNL